jgi:hypothetical protein
MHTEQYELFDESSAPKEKWAEFISPDRPLEDATGAGEWSLRSARLMSKQGQDRAMRATRKYDLNAYDGVTPTEDEE